MNQFWVAVLVGAIIIGILFYLLRGEEVPPVCEAVYIDHGVVQNWFGNRCWKPSQIVTPASLDELLQLIRDIYRRNKEGERVTVRMVGALHSWSGCAECEGGIMIRGDKLNKVLAVDEQNLIIKVEAGVCSD
jgi:FAD/FMN-containing dehydrogenase